MKTRVKLLLLMLLAMAITTQVKAMIYYVNDRASWAAAATSVYYGTGGDTVKITGNIVFSKDMEVDGTTYHVGDTPEFFGRDCTVTADTNPDGSPKYTLDGDNLSAFWICTNLKNFVVENLIIKNMVGPALNIQTDSDAVIKINNCIALNNNGTGIFVSAQQGKVEISNCTSSNNTVNGFAVIAMETVIHDCVAENNKNNGFDVYNIQYKDFIVNYMPRTQIYNCTATGNSQGFLIEDVKNTVMNNCSALRNGGGVEVTCQNGGEYIITNTTAANNTGSSGFWFGDVSGKLVNCTAFQNLRGVYYASSYADTYEYSRKVYNSIIYGNEKGDFDLYYSKWKLSLYNTVYGTKDGTSYGTIESNNCRMDDPKLIAMTADGNFTELPYEIAYYSLTEGSPASGLADKSLITVENLTEFNYDYISPEAGDWFKNIITAEYVNNILMHDQLDNVRSFDGNNYDAGSISGTGGMANSRIISYSPQKVANYGRNIILFYGYDFDDHTKISLKKQGENDVPADACTITESNASSGLLKCSAEFNFNKKALGKWNIVVDFGDTIVTIPNGLEIEEYIEPEVDIEIIGNDNLRNGAWTNYIVQYQNTGNVPVYNVPIIIDIVIDKESTATIKEGWQYVVPDGLDVSEIDKIDTLIDPFTGKLHTYIAPNVRYIGPYSTGYLSFSVKINEEHGINKDIEISAAVFKPMFIVNPDSAALEASSSDGTMRAGGPCGIAANENFSACQQASVDVGVEIGLDIAQALIPGLGCLTSAASTECNALDNINTMDGLHYAGNLAWDITKTVMECVTDFIPVTKMCKAAWNIVKAMKTADDWISKTNMGLDLYNSCKKEKKKNGSVIASDDPNDKIGPVSESGSTWFSDRKEFPYIIDFENKSSASAPAQEIWITDNLDLNVFDINTFEAGIIKIGDRLLEAPSHIQNFTWSVDMPEKNLTVNIDLKLDKTTGIATWHFKCVDPATGELPTDPSAGFLPPDDGNGSGQGLVAYTIQLKDGLANNVTVANKASIVFDNNDPIVTPTWENKKDVVPPTSKMLSASNTGNGFAELKWQGTDNTGGSGVYSYDVFMKHNNDDYVMIYSGITETSAQFAIEKGANYSFYTIATDNAGNREIKTNVPDVTLGIANVKADSQNSFKLYPNPADKECTLAFDMEKPGNVKITLSNILGANLMKIYDGYAESGTFKHTFDISSLPTGVYTVLIYAGNRVMGEKLMIVK